MKLKNIILSVALGISSAYAHDPDFSKLDKPYMLERIAVIKNIFKTELSRKKMGFGTMFKIGESKGKHYYASAAHLNKRALPDTAVGNTAYDLWYSNGKQMKLEIRDPINDVMIVSTIHDFSDKPIVQCKSPPNFGEKTYTYGYNAGHLSIGEGRIGSLESKVMGNNKTYYLTDADTLSGSSGGPSYLYRKNKFCVYGMILGNIGRGDFSVSNDIKHTFYLYKELLSLNNSR